MKQFFNAVGKREVKGFSEDVVILEPSKGGFRISPKIAQQLGVDTESFIVIQYTEAEDGSLEWYIGKGKDGVPSLDENGNIVLDKRGHKVYEKPGFGATIAETTPGSNVFRFSNAFAWDNMGGSAGKRLVFELGEGEAHTIPAHGKETLDTVLFPLVLLREEEVAERTKKEKKETSEEVEENLDLETTQEVNEVASSADEDINL